VKRSTIFCKDNVLSILHNEETTYNDNVSRKRDGVRVVVFNASFNNISAITWRSVSLVKETMVVGFTTTCAISAY
jgi:hypothetical protein